MSNSGQQNQAQYQVLYFQLMGQYSTLAETYHNQAEQNFKLYQQLSTLMEQKITLLQDEVPTQALLPSPLPPPEPTAVLQFRQTVSEREKKPLRRHRFKREGRTYRCTYPECIRVYRSSVSMNLHIKLKHNGGTKKQRQAVAKILIVSEQRGVPAPEMQLNLPPDFLQEFKKNYQYTKKYNM